MRPIIHLLALIVVVYASSTAFGHSSRPRPSTIYQIMEPPPFQYKRSSGYPFRAHDIRFHLRDLPRSKLTTNLTCKVLPHRFANWSMPALPTDSMLDFSGSKLRIWPNASWRSIRLREDTQQEIWKRAWRPDGGSSLGENRFTRSPITPLCHSSLRKCEEVKKKFPEGLLLCRCLPLLS